MVAAAAMEMAQMDHARQNAAAAMCLTNATLRPDRSGNVTAQRNLSNWATGSPAGPEAARQYSGTVGGIALCQVAVTLTYATGRGHALIGRALYLPEGPAARWRVAQCLAGSATVRGARDSPIGGDRAGGSVAKVPQRPSAFLGGDCYFVAVAAWMMTAYRRCQRGECSPAAVSR